MRHHVLGHPSPSCGSGTAELGIALRLWLLTIAGGARAILGQRGALALEADPASRASDAGMIQPPFRGPT